MSNYSKYAYVLVAVFATWVFMFIFSSLTGRAYAALPSGYPNNSIPNGSYWQTPPRTQLANLVVAEGGMSAPGMYVDFFIPTTSASSSFTIINACDDSNIDVGIARGNTYYRFEGTTSFVDTGGNGIVTGPSPAEQEVECGSGTDLNFTIVADSTLPIETFGGVQYRRVYFSALVYGYLGGDYENQFRIQSSDAAVVLSYPSFASTGGYIGLYNRTSNLNSGACSNNTTGKNDNSCYWNIDVALAPPCDWTPGKTAQVDFYDNDSQPGGYQSTRKMNYSVYKYPRSGAGAPSFVASGTLNGGNNDPESTPNIAFDPAYMYEMRLTNIFARNSLQVRLPWEQINANDGCAGTTPPQPGYTKISGRVYDKTKNIGAGLRPGLLGTICINSMPSYLPGGQPAGYIVDMATTPTGNGWWLLGRDGGVFAFGDAAYYGSAASDPGPDIFSGIAASLDGSGYALVKQNGDIFNYGTSALATRFAAPAGETFEGIAAFSNTGYWMVTNKGGVYSVDGAPFYGSASDNSFVGIVATPDRSGYSLIKNNGNIFNYGAGPGYPNPPPQSNVVGIASTSTNRGGYYYVRNDGSIGGWGDAFRPNVQPNGYFTFPMSLGRNYCVELNGPAGLPGYDGPELAGDYPGIVMSPDKYVGQVSGTNAGSSDRDSDSGFDFAYTPATPAACNAAGSAIVGDRVEFTNNKNASLLWSGGGTPSGDSGITFNTTFNTPGNYTVNGFAPGVSVTCNITITPAPTRPFFQVNRGDVSAGGGFNSATGCMGANPNAGILAFNTGAGSYFGAGTSLAAFAWDKIYGFTSAAGRSSPSTPAPPKGLSFSNTSGGGDPKYGGSFGYAPCATDYAKLPISGSSGYTETTPLAPYTINSLSVPNAPSPDSRQVIRVKGNIIITDNISYTGKDSWTSISDIPSLYVIADGGNIYIGPGVTQLDGVYVAQPDSAGVGGTIYTCSNGTILYDDSNLYSACISSLTVNGSFIAKTIKLLRTKGDYKDSASPPAEIFNYTPELFLVPSPFTKLAPYQSITNLPPVL